MNLNEIEAMIDDIAHALTRLKLEVQKERARIWALQNPSPHGTSYCPGDHCYPCSCPCHGTDGWPGGPG